MYVSLMYQIWIVKRKLQLSNDVWLLSTTFRIFLCFWNLIVTIILQHLSELQHLRFPENNWELKEHVLLSLYFIYF